MRYLRIFLLHFQDVLEYRSISFVWFLVAVLNPMLYLLFWHGATLERGEVFTNWSLSNIASYYFLLVIAGSVLMAHVEYDVAVIDIQRGELAKYLTRPFSYFLFKFFYQIPWRLIQGVFALLVFMLFMVFTNNLVVLTTSPSILALSISIAILAFLLSFFFKMFVGFAAFWMTDIFGLQQLIEIIILVFAGYIIPLEFLPTLLKSIANLTPFPYMIYYPIIAFQGRLNIEELMQVITTQFVWLSILGFMYYITWSAGLRRFTAVGQ